MDGLKPEEMDFMLSLEGKAAIARARREHEVREAWKGPLEALPWTEGHAAAAVRAGFIGHQRERLAAAVFEAGADYRHGESLALKALRNEALASRKQSRNA